MKRILAFLATGSWPGTGNRIIQSVDRLFYQPSIAANLSSQTGGNHGGESPPPVSSSVHNALFFPLRLPLLTSFFSAPSASRNTRHEATKVSPHPPSSSAGILSPLPGLAPLSLGPVKFCRPVVYPRRRLAFTRIRILCRPGPVVGDETTPMQKTQRGRPHLIQRGLLKPRGIRNCAIVARTPPLRYYEPKKRRKKKERGKENGVSFPLNNFIVRW